jgi:hypothetical protein
MRIALHNSGVAPGQVDSISPRLIAAQRRGGDPHDQDGAGEHAYAVPVGGKAVPRARARRFGPSKPPLPAWPWSGLDPATLNVDTTMMPAISIT